MKTFDTLIRGATMITSGSTRRVVRDAAIGIRDGRFAWVGAIVDLPADAIATDTLNLPGRVCLPGFINVHTHAILTMVRGVAEDMGFAPAYTPGVPHGHDVTPDEAVAMARLGAVKALLFGSTLINDSYVHADRTVEPMAALGLRVVTCGRIHDADFSLIGDGRWEHHDTIGDTTLQAAVDLAEAWHGRANGRINVQLAAHAPDTCSDALLRRIGVTARQLRLRVNTHLSQSAAENAQIRRRANRTPTELLDEVGLLNDHLIAAHCIHVTTDDIARIGRAKLNVAHVPKGNATGGTRAPTTALRAAGANIALGTDNMHADMIEVMRWALAIARIQEGRVDDAWQPWDALEMASINGARAMGLDQDIGAIEVGKKADVVVIDARRPHLTPHVNLLGSVVHCAQGLDVEHVFVDGRQVVASGRPTQVDLDSVLADAQAAADALWRRARAT